MPKLYTSTFLPTYYKNDYTVTRSRFNANVLIKSKPKIITKTLKFKHIVITGKNHLITGHLQNTYFKKLSLDTKNPDSTDIFNLVSKFTGRIELHKNLFHLKTFNKPVWQYIQYLENKKPCLNYYNNVNTEKILDECSLYKLTKNDYNREYCKKRYKETTLKALESKFYTKITPKFFPPQLTNHIANYTDLNVFKCLMETSCFYIIPNDMTYFHPMDKLGLPPIDYSKPHLLPKWKIEEKHKDILEGNSYRSLHMSVYNDLKKLHGRYQSQAIYFSELDSKIHENPVFGNHLDTNICCQKSTTSPFSEYRLNSFYRRSGRESARSLTKKFKGKKKYNQNKTVYRQSLVLDDDLLNSVVVEEVCECKFGFKIVLKMPKITSYDVGGMPNRLMIFCKRVFSVDGGEAVVFGKRHNLVENVKQGGGDHRNLPKPGLYNLDLEAVYMKKKRLRIEKSKTRKVERFEKYHKFLK